MKVVRTQAAIREALHSVKMQGRTVGFVATMGALHEGHLALVRAARRSTDVVVMSIFVNPLQFGPSEDFGSYPRPEETDLRAAQEQGVDVVFAPSLDEMYGAEMSTTVSAGGLARMVEGAERPGHFDGVCTVVAKLFNLVHPDRAFFGQKDAQQVAVIRRMVSDLSFPVEVEVVPIVREPDGLAMSSRNAYLSPEERTRATALYAALREGEALVRRGASVEAVEDRMLEVMGAVQGVEPGYARAVDPDTFETPGGGPVLLAVAARVGPARLIDNLLVEPSGVGE